MDQAILKQFEKLCTADSLPACQAVCPFHLDVRGLVEHIGRGDWKKARVLLEKSLPFAPLMSALCDAPCENVCLRIDLGGAIGIKALELVCFDAALYEAQPRRMFAKGQRIGVLGSGLAGLVASWELSHKGYDVTLYHRGSGPADFLRNRIFEGRSGIGYWTIVPPRISGEQLEYRLNETLERLAKRGVRFAREGNPYLKGIIQVHDAVFVDVEEFPALAPMAVDEVTGCDFDARPDDPGLAFGGFSPSSSARAFEGRRGAVTLTRILGKSSPRAMREKEGPYSSSLFVNVQDVAAAPRPRMDTPFTVEEAIKEASRCIQCRCRLCFEGCAYMQKYDDYPKVNARKMFVNLGIVTGYRHANRQINSCALCGQCEGLCPNGFSMGGLCLLMRKEMVLQGKMPPSAHDFALRELENSTSPASTLVLGADGQRPCSTVFFPGCQLVAARPQQVRFMFRYLRQELSQDCGIWSRCCGIPAHFAGRDDLVAQQVEALLAQWAGLGSPEVIVACASCLRFFRRYLAEVPVRSLWEVLDKVAPLPSQDHGQLNGTIHDPCSARHDSVWLQAVRNILDNNNIGYDEPRYTGETTPCCGYGGLVWNADRELSDQMAMSRAGDLKSTALTSCIMCRDRLADSGAGALYLFDIILPSEEFLQSWLTDNAPQVPVLQAFKTLAEEGARGSSNDMPLRKVKDWETLARAKSPGYSQRRLARIKLKQDFITTEYGLEPPQSERPLERGHGASLSGRCTDTHGATAPFSLSISPEVLEGLEMKHILLQDIEETIVQAEKSGAVFVNSKTGSSLAWHRQGNVTFWVEYSLKNNIRTILDAYCHRMTIAGA